MPASGKSTYARELVAQGYKRVNKDDLRAMIDSSVWSPENERFIYAIRNSIISKALHSGANVVVDDTNCRVKDVKEIAKLARDIDPNVEVRVALFNTPYEVCKERNSKRIGKEKVPEDALQRLHKLLQLNLVVEEENENEFPK